MPDTPDWRAVAQKLYRGACAAYEDPDVDEATKEDLKTGMDAYVIAWNQARSSHEGAEDG